jgi:hypothetical protein
VVVVAESAQALRDLDDAVRECDERSLASPRSLEAHQATARSGDRAPRGERLDRSRDRPEHMTLHHRVEGS